ncbi:MAG: GGDEF domain-containing protein, partial [Campylobacterales bacterium]|nr:GGDEF domain-containing protein [Campylobacterales bacterium]
KVDFSIELMHEIFEYFNLMKSFTAKGYLNRMLQEDKKDIELFFLQTDNDKNHLPKNIILEKVTWLKNLLDAIEHNQEFDQDGSSKIFNAWIDEIHFISQSKIEFFRNLEERILINTKNLFYFIKKEDYFEILPLYTSLLSIYKLTLMMNNAMTVEYASNVIENMKLDALTKLYRKDFFEEILEKEFRLTNTHALYSFTLVYLDLDDFKAVNDTYGHYMGDKVIEKLGESIRSNIRPIDYGFRIGGDEFAIILKNSNHYIAKEIVKNIASVFSSYAFEFNDNTTFHVTLSIGLVEESSCHAHENTKALMKDVDKHLYDAKTKGKNQISS